MKTTPYKKLKQIKTTPTTTPQSYTPDTDTRTRRKAEIKQKTRSSVDRSLVRSHERCTRIIKNKKNNKTNPNKKTQKRKKKDNISHSKSYNTQAKRDL